MLFLSQCMDLQAMIMVDITQIDCKEGVEVIVFNTQEMIQHTAEIILYETLTVISPRIKDFKEIILIGCLFNKTHFAIKLFTLLKTIFLNSIYL